MKAGESFQLDPAWWRKGKPNMLKPTGLGKALDDYAAAIAAFEKKLDDNKLFTAALDALDAADKARLKAIGLCGNDYANTRAALGRANVIATEEARVKDLRKRRFAPALRQLKTRVADLRRHNTKTKAQVADFEKNRNKLDPKKRAEELKKIRLNADYLNNALQGGSTALHALEGHSAFLKASFPDLSAEFETNKSAFNTLRQSSKVLRDRMDKIRA
jgi:hypothetical protein